MINMKVMVNILMLAFNISGKGKKENMMETEYLRIVITSIQEIGKWEKGWEGY